jgi:hypothetical protein
MTNRKILLHVYIGLARLGFWHGLSALKLRKWTPRKAERAARFNSLNAPQNSSGLPLHCTMYNGPYVARKTGPRPPYAAFVTDAQPPHQPWHEHGDPQGNPPRQSPSSLAHWKQDILTRRVTSYHAPRRWLGHIVDDVAPVVHAAEEAVKS